ncbi:hypothetical protein [Gorillibacterium massiliense]|uniref:hypothetical protein n=1 Tax=Gorillibacterium massiliense TaxID=1280390 RepID=UPI0004AD79CF|nr:hypothetical protein [Gorillibacterium massiliense]
MEKEKKTAQDMRQEPPSYLLFDDEDGIYNYCPSPVCVDETTMVIFYCANTWPGLVIDDIYARKGKLEDGRWTFGDKFRVLQPERTGWDCIHVCDPDVIRGEFHYRGEDYSWLMVYLGCDIHHCYHNQIGIAFAKSIEGPYVKYEGNPIVGYDEVFHWGNGQASLLSLDGKGKIRMLYSQTVHEYERRLQLCRTFWRDLDLSDADHPIIGEEVAMHEGGLMNRDGSKAEAAFNPTIAWDRERDLIYLSREGTPFDKTRSPDFIAPYTQLAVISRSDFERNEGGWTVVHNFGAEDTGFERNHNAGIIKNAYGWLQDSCRLPMALTVSELKDRDFLWTYRIYHRELLLPDSGLSGREEW